MKSFSNPPGWITPTSLQACQKWTIRDNEDYILSEGSKKLEGVIGIVRHCAKIARLERARLVVGPELVVAAEAVKIFVMSLVSLYSNQVSERLQAWLAWLWRMARGPLT